MKKLILNPNEMAIRKVYWSLVRAHKVSTFFRPGVRLCNVYRGYCKKQNINLRCILQTGSDYYGVEPIFSEENIKVSIKEIYSKKIGELNNEDFLGSSPDVNNKLSLKYHLGLIYNIDIDKINDDFDVTIVKITYLNNNINAMKNILENLIQNGLWKIAKMPLNNALDFSSKDMMVTLINHDYPAKTPFLWNGIFKKYNIEAKSIVLTPNTEVEKNDLKLTFDVYRSDKRFKLGGFGVGFKDESIELLDILDESAKRVSAANFVYKNKNNELVGYNTDGEGFVRGLKENYPEFSNLKGKRILLLGSGGTANAISYALANEGANLIIANRTIEKAINLANSINDYFKVNNLVIGISEGELENYISKIDLLINTSIKGAEGKWSDYLSLAETSNGLNNNLSKGKQLLNSLNPKVIVVDIILKSIDTPLIFEAKKIGIKTMNGVPMVIAQAALAFYISYGKERGIQFSDIYKEMKKLI